MKFKELLFLYAVISCPSDNPATQSLRTTLKKIFDKVLSNIDSSNVKSFSNMIPEYSVKTLKELLGFSDERQITVIRNVIDEIKKNPSSIKIAIQEDVSENDIYFNCKTYLDEKLAENYPQIEQYYKNIKNWGALVIHYKDLEKPNPPILQYSFRTSQRFSLGNSTNSQITLPLLSNSDNSDDAGFKKICCSII